MPQSTIDCFRVQNLGHPNQMMKKQRQPNVHIQWPHSIEKWSIAKLTQIELLER